jgi:hypothetical protein
VAVVYYVEWEGDEVFKGYEQVAANERDGATTTARKRHRGGV